MNLLFLVLWVFALPFPRLRPLASSISAVWACVMVVCKMFYQLKVIKPLDYSSNCTAVSIHNCVSFFQLFPMLLSAGWLQLHSWTTCQWALTITWCHWFSWSMYLHNQKNFCHVFKALSFRFRHKYLLKMSYTPVYSYRFVVCISEPGTVQQLWPGWWSGAEWEHDGAAQEVYSLHRACRSCLLVWSTA